MTKTVEITARVHRSVPECCRASVLQFAAGDRYRGGGEPGDQIRCGCGNTLIFTHTGPSMKQLGWKVAA